ncbi:MAG: VOC family protein [Streptomycetales bacterium]
MDPIGRLAVVVLDCDDPRALAEFYTSLLGWRADPDDTSDDWVQLVADAGATLAFQRVEGYRPPDWPGQDLPQQLHLDVDVPDLDVGERAVLAIGARKHGVQPSPSNFRVYLDPAGHPFCLCRA